MLKFHANIHADPGGINAGQIARLRCLDISTLDVVPGDLSRPLDVSFEAVIEAFESFPQVFSEPDGSFALIRHADNLTLQLDGNIFDRDDHVVYVELKGTCTSQDFDRLLNTLGWPDAPLIYQLAREAVFVDESEFRRYAAVREV